MSKLTDTIERALFGATTEERIERVAQTAPRLHQRAIERMEDRIVAALEADDDADGDAESTSE